MPRGPGKSSNYNLDYSRFNSLGTDDDGKDLKSDQRVQAEEQEVSTDGDPSFTDMLRKMPPELQEAYRLMAISRQTGDEKAQQRANELALKAVEKGGPEVRQTFMNEVSKHMPKEAGLDGLDSLDGLDDTPATDAKASPEVLGNRIERMKVEMQAGKEATRKQLDSLQKQQEQLESMSSPEDFMKFMQKEGMSNDDLQRMLTGDQAHMESMVSKMLNKAADVGEQEAGKLSNAEKAVKQAEDLHQSILGRLDSPCGVEEKSAPKAEASPAKAKSEAPKKEEEVVIPNHRLQYQKDADGRYTAVELTCTLPGVADMGCIALDVAEKHLRLTTVAPAPRYAVNAGPFPVLIEASQARAKFSKKRQELSLTVPAKGVR